MLKYALTHRLRRFYSEVDMYYARNMVMFFTVTLGLVASIRAMQLSQEDKNNKLFHAIGSGFGDVEDVRNAIEQGALVDAKNQWDKTPLYEACWRTHVPAVRLLLDRGARLDTKNSVGKTTFETIIGHMLYPPCPRAVMFSRITKHSVIIPLCAAYDDEDSWQKLDPACKKVVQDRRKAVTVLMLERYHDLRLQWNYAYHAAMRMSNNTLPAVLAEDIADIKVSKLAVVAKRLGLQKLNLEKKRLPGFYPLPQPEAIRNQVE